MREDWRKAQKKDELIDLQRASATWKELKAGKTPSPSEMEAYNATVRSAVVQLAKNWSTNREALSQLSTTNGSVSLSLDPVITESVLHLDHLAPADFVKIKGALKNHYTVDGLGAAMVARTNWSEIDPMVPRSGVWFPLTAFLNLDKPTAPVLGLKDPTRNGGNISLGGRQVPLSADYSAFIARDFQERQKQILDVPAMFRFEYFQERMGLQRISAFDPNKKPCILVHGLNSSPSTWSKTVNEFISDQQIREEYEFWTFGYPSGAPIPYLALKFRESVDQMCAFREANGATQPKLTVVGHSMGGLLAKTMTQTSGDENWNRVFRVPVDELQIKGENRKLLRDMLYFEPHDHIDKMIFVAVPHQGSHIAKAAPAKLVGDMIQVPRQLMAISREILKTSKSDLTPLGLMIAKEVPTSLDQLRLHSKTMELFSAMPLNPKVRYYSVIGNSSRPGVPLEKTDDNMVPYLSAHLTGVESEKVIRSDHKSHQAPEGIAEIIRILKLP